MKQSTINKERQRNQLEKIFRNITCNLVWHRQLRNTVYTAYKNLKLRFDWKLIGGQEETIAKRKNLKHNTWCSPGLYEFHWNSSSKQPTTQQLWLPASDLNKTSMKLKHYLKQLLSIHNCLRQNSEVSAQIWTNVLTIITLIPFRRIRWLPCSTDTPTNILRNMNGYINISIDTSYALQISVIAEAGKTTESQITYLNNQPTTAMEKKHTDL